MKRIASDERMHAWEGGTCMLHFYAQAKNDPSHLIKEPTHAKMEIVVFLLRNSTVDAPHCGSTRTASLSDLRSPDLSMHIASDMLLGLCIPDAARIFVDRFMADEIGSFFHHMAASLDMIDLRKPMVTKARIQIWLFEQKDLRIEGRIIDRNTPGPYFCASSAALKHLTFLRGEKAPQGAAKAAKAHAKGAWACLDPLGVRNIPLRQ
ncbi:hypothetical protein Taro_004145 [Colocasia esculenta]|uniref:Uncharacterized protein n=1 Tax=Colocasia esculenta TaxID=4460 RepID=A0A843TU02_COLES|nr:hypothetical protein [Colocasia esculenta]